MASERAIRLRIVTSDDGTKCDPLCPHHGYYYVIAGHESQVDEVNPAWSVCDWNDPHRQQAEGAPLNVRHQSCIAAEVSDGE